jgi:hypothetical protein
MTRKRERSNGFPLGKMLVIKTPGGGITAEGFPKNDYPCIDIRINGQVAAVVEWDKGIGKFRIHSWDNINEDPASSVVFDDSPDNEGDIDD